MEKVRLTSLQLGVELVRLGVLPTGVRGYPTAFGHKPDSYVSTDEGALAQAGRLLIEQDFEFLMRDVTIIEPNYYAHLFTRSMPDGMESESVELRLVRDGAAPLALALVGIKGAHVVRFGGQRVAYWRDSPVAMRMMEEFIREFPSYGHRWIPLFDDFPYV